MRDAGDILKVLWKVLFLYAQDIVAWYTQGAIRSQAISPIFTTDGGWLLRWLVHVAAMMRSSAAINICYFPEEEGRKRFLYLCVFLIS